MTQRCAGNGSVSRSCWPARYAAPCAPATPPDTIATMTTEGGPALGAAYWLRVTAVTGATAVLLTVLFATYGGADTLFKTVRNVLVHSTLMAGLCGAVMPWVRRRLRNAGPAVQWAATVPTLLAVAIVGTALAIAFVGVVDGRPRAAFWPAFAFSLPINALLAMTLGVGMTLYEAQRARLHAVSLELRARELEHERTRKMALQAQLASLESRLQPHFLFNTLNAISALIQEDPDQAERMVERLAALLRFSLDATGRGLVPLADELKIVADYLEIERTRLGPRLAFAVDGPGDVSRCEVPPLAVQTLVENSVKHAIAPRPDGGTIRIVAARAGETLRLTVWDDGPGFTAAAMWPGHGLDSLRARLAARYGATATLSVDRRDGGTLVTVSLPLAREAP
jgi:two-component system sensor histidine kinase AlgZ